MGNEIKEVEDIGVKVAKGVLRIVAGAIGALGAIILVIVNATISVANKTGVFGVHTTHGWIGLLAFAVGLIGALTTLFKPTWGALLMVVAGLGFIYVAGAGAILATPFLLIAGGLAYIDRPKPAK
jgi:hypothetical protein